ncbi:hypothetical protein Tco_0910219 [Tanacetum coccineum]|uniref:Reverse transcriptase domain-containing protein n=1 Tax=Tanacetum coccineum TaxID=301880 RepID=A0ABQ5CT74_9ASTR
MKGWDATSTTEKRISLMTSFLALVYLISPFVENDSPVSVLYRTFFDHCPILLKAGLSNFGPKPFRIFDKCIGNADLLEVISNSWAQSCDPVTSLTRNASQKKSREDLLQSLLDWDIKAEAGLIDDIDISKREEWIMDLNHLDQLHRMTLNKSINGLWYDSPSLIKQAAFDYFSSRFKEVSKLRPTFSSSNYLELSISMDEIKTAVLDCSGSKAPGPDAKVISSVIGPNQTAFISGRQILDGCLVANEIVRMVHIEKLKLMVFKFDFEKAFDRINWHFLH